MLPGPVAVVTDHQQALAINGSEVESDASTHPADPHGSEESDSCVRNYPLALDVQYESGAGAVLPDRLSWARSRLKEGGFLASGVEGEIPSGNPDAEFADWRDKLLALLRAMDPSAFERLCQRLLRESGFVKVEVTGRSGDGGIDGTGILQLSLMSFHVLFQCKRYQGSVGSGAVRDFRGAMMGRTDKGLVITTGTFSPDARREATRDGAPPIDLIDGESLCEKLKELKLGVEIRIVEETAIKTDWFAQI